MSQKDEDGNEASKSSSINGLLRPQGDMHLRTHTGNEHCYLIEYVAHGETKPRRTLLPQALLLGRTDEPLKALRSLGVTVLRSTAKHIVEYLDREHLRFSSQRPQDFWQRHKRPDGLPIQRTLSPPEVLQNGSGPGGVWYAGNTQDEIFSCKRDA